jgi:hypothetical protein
MSTEISNYGNLYLLQGGELLRPATETESKESRAAADRDGGVGAIVIDGRTCYVQE